MYLVATVKFGTLDRGDDSNDQYKDFAIQDEQATLDTESARTIHYRDEQIRKCSKYSRQPCL